jgi:hypothetical protein
MLAGHAPVHIYVQIVSTDAQAAPNGDGWKFPGLNESPDGAGRYAQVVGNLINSQQQRVRHVQMPPLTNSHVIVDDGVPCGSAYLFPARINVRGDG